MNKPSPYRSYSLKALALLLNSSPGDSATHRAIREELRRRQLKNDPGTDNRLIFTARELAQLGKWPPAKSAKPRKARAA